MIKRLAPVLAYVIITAIFFWQFLFKGLLPIPSDTIVGLYYPYRDLYAKDYPNGIPFKNFLITDPVRQQYPWKNLSINSYKNLSLPTWNPYSFSGTPNLANFQSAVFYPLNILFLVLPLYLSWSILILIQPLFAGIFLYYYLRNLKLDEYSSFLGGVVFAFSGFFVMWLEWGTVLQTALWLPLILLSIDKISTNLKKGREVLVWSGIFIFSLCSSFFGGHFQIFFYLSIFSMVYAVLRIWEAKNRMKLFLIFLVLSVISLIITLPQLVPALKFINLSARQLDQFWQKEGWFIPFQHFVQFVAPDFFGNPTTLNYWGTWNYGELTGFVGIVALILSIFAIIFRRDKKTLFFSVALFVSILLVFSNPVSRLPFIFDLPFISTAQPTRFLFIADFCLSVLAALGLNYLILKGKPKQLALPLIFVGGSLLILFFYLQFGVNSSSNLNNFLIAKRNLYFPGAIFAVSFLLLLLITIAKKKFTNYLVLFLILLTVIELFRFSWKFNTFSKQEYLYPETASIKFLEQNIGIFRIATNDARIMAPNFPIMHNLYSVEGYDPLYLERYGELVAAINRDKPDINPPFGFNRIIRVENFSSNLVDLMGVKYVMSLTEMNIIGFKKVFEEGETKIYENDEVLPRTFFVKEIKVAKDKNEAIIMMFDKDFIPLDQAVVEEELTGKFSQGEAKITKYSDNEIIIQTQNDSLGFLVLTDTFYPTWHAKINGKDEKVYRTDFNFRGIVVPAGKNTVVLRNELL